MASACPRSLDPARRGAHVVHPQVHRRLELGLGGDLVVVEDDDGAHLGRRAAVGVLVAGGAACRLGEDDSEGLVVLVLVVVDDLDRERLRDDAVRERQRAALGDVVLARLRRQPIRRSA